jgi:hypothetical protein
MSSASGNRAGPERSARDSHALHQPPVNPPPETVDRKSKIGRSSSLCSAWSPPSANVALRTPPPDRARPTRLSVAGGAALGGAGAAAAPGSGRLTRRSATWALPCRRRAATGGAVPAGLVACSCRSVKPGGPTRAHGNRSLRSRRIPHGDGGARSPTAPGPVATRWSGFLAVPRRACSAAAPPAPTAVEPDSTSLARPSTDGIPHHRNLSRNDAANQERSVIDTPFTLASNDGQGG